MPDTMTRPPDWVDVLCDRSVALDHSALLRPLSETECLERQRVESLLAAWEAWDLGRCVMHLAYSLRHVALGDEARQRRAAVSA